MENRKEIMHLVNQIDKLKAKAKLDGGYRFDVKPNWRDPEKWVHVFKTDELTREWIKQLLKEIWELNKDDAYRECRVDIDCGERRKILPLPPGTRVGKSCPDGF